MKKIFVWALSILYIYILLKLLILREDALIPNEMFVNKQLFNTFRVYTFGFFSGDVTFWQFFVNIIANVLIFIPFGFFGMIILKKRTFWVILLGAMFIVTIETFQMITAVGIFDVDDIWLNILGVIIGVVFYKLYIVLKNIKKRAQ